MRGYRHRVQRILIGLLAIILVGLIYLAWPVLHSIEPGVTFSILQAEGLGLIWRDAYEALLTDMQVKHLRLVAYWNRIEKTPTRYDFKDLDIQMDMAADHNARVVLAIGRKVPRWPECHVPTWAQGFPEEKQQEAVLSLLTALVERYKDHPALEMWQVENEPLLAFGHCPPFDRSFFQKELALVKSLDSHPILVTDSGELSWWFDAGQYGDIFGTTMYRTVFSGRTQQLFSYDYILPAWVYRLKAHLIGLIYNKSVIVSELQGEPWANKSFIDTSRQERSQSFSVERFLQINRFARRVGLSRVYWWGAEYWYWEKVHQGDARFWEIGKEVMQP